MGAERFTLPDNPWTNILVVIVICVFAYLIVAWLIAQLKQKGGSGRLAVGLLGTLVIAAIAGLILGVGHDVTVGGDRLSCPASVQSVQFVPTGSWPLPDVAQKCKRDGTVALLIGSILLLADVAFASWFFLKKRAKQIRR